MINVFQPALGTEELEAVRKVFESNWVGKGRLTDRFEAEFASYLGVDRALIRSLTCCTEGLFLSMALLEIGPGDEVILPSISFVGAGNAVAASGARPVFCDVDPRTLNTTAEHIAPKITPKTRAVMILHYGGLPCQMDEICALVEGRRLALIEDSACSVASRYHGRACGTFGDVGAWSFDAMKILVTGDGSMLYAREPEMAERAEQLLYLGLVSKSGLARAQSVDSRWWEFEISCFGRRVIMNDIASAIGLEQLKKLPGFIRRRREVHERYTDALSDLDWLRVPSKLPKGVESSYYFYWVQVEPGVRDKLAWYLREQGVYTTFRYYPLHWVGLYNAGGSLPNAELAAQTTLCIPMHHSLSDSDVHKVIDCIRLFGQRYV